MKKQGFSDKDIIEFSTQVKGVAYTEIAHIISQPLRNFIYSNQKKLINMSNTYFVFPIINVIYLVYTYSLLSVSTSSIIGNWC